MLPEWLSDYETALWWLGALSVVCFIGTLIAIPMLVARIPVDYFTRHREPPGPIWRSVSNLPSVVARNTLGVILILAGIAMLVLPGQGVLTILLGLMLMNFPGKHNLERQIIEQPTVLRAINWMRAKSNTPPLISHQSDKKRSSSDV